MTTYCRRCHRYEMYGPCRCEIRGHAWFVENGEESASEIWSLYDTPDLFLDAWAARLDANDCMEKFGFDESAVAFRPCGEGKPVSYHTIQREMVPQYNVHSADKEDDTISEARRWRARDLVQERKRQRARRATA
jgi:hypothetical protein